jgi:hypothetical protein
MNKSKKTKKERKKERKKGINFIFLGDKLKKEF